MQLKIFQLLAGLAQHLQAGARVTIPAWPTVYEQMGQGSYNENEKVRYNNLIPHPLIPHPVIYCLILMQANQEKANYNYVLSWFTVRIVNPVESTLGAVTHVVGEQMDKLKKATVHSNLFFLEFIKSGVSINPEENSSFLGFRTYLVDFQVSSEESEVMIEPEVEEKEREEELEPNSKRTFHKKQLQAP